MIKIFLVLSLLLPASTHAFAPNDFTATKILTACDMSANCTSTAVNVDTKTITSIQAVMTGSPVGTLKLQVSNDIVTNPNLSPTNWADYTGSSQAVSSSGTFVYNIPDVGFGWIRMVYTFTSGTGALTATVRTKAH